MLEAWQKLSAFCVGCGSIGRRHVEVLASLGVEDIRIFDPNEENVRQLLDVTPGAVPVASFEEGLAGKPDTVFVFTPPKLHIPMSTAAVQAGCHVFCEKPLSMSLEGIDELDALAREKKLTVMVGMCMRFQAGIRIVKEMLDAGRIGRLVAVRAIVGEYFPDARPDFRTAYYSKYSGALDLVHEIDLAIWFAGRPIRRVAAMHGAYSDLGIEAPDVAAVLIDFEQRCLASIHLDFFGSPRRRCTELFGVDGSIVITWPDWRSYRVVVHERATGKNETIEGNAERNDMYAAEQKVFLEAVAAGKTVACNLMEAKKSVEVVVQALEQS